MKKAYDIIQKIIFILTNIIIVLLIILGFYYIFQTRINKVKKEEVFPYILFIVNTGSMANTINVNDIILVKKTENIIENDIIAFKEKDEFIVHRIIKKNPEEIITKGDANNQEDEPIRYEQIIGKVIYVISLKTIILITLFIITFNTILILNEKIKERRKD